ncbi:cytidine deaminase [Phyllobacterium chamaecytisi]|uniref:cytidine deaminase n=1 Tax=Phyllobacterium chamaecytisi TaxID=2876082 RepID=UPI001CCA4B80|nr:cytidine deaminase [Phyllobacterium sp. KW56]MBZ9603292.1 cytidine deaminase [Phyllobacterium sp. KW56]
MNQIKNRDSLIQNMFEAAVTAHKNAVVPYCKFPVSACVTGKGSSLYVGVNIDNKVPGQTICAESVALGSMIAAGEDRLSHVLVIAGVSGMERFCMPCGGCRQRLLGFSDKNTLIHTCLHDGRIMSRPLFDLIPFRKAIC